MIATRSALVAWGRTPPPDLAYLTSDGHGDCRIVTWAEVMEGRRKRQAQQLEFKRRVTPIRAYRFSVRYYDMPLMGGWQSALDDWRGHRYGVWPDRDMRWFKPVIMKLIPLSPSDLLPFGDENDQWEEWKIAFAHKFKRRMVDKHPAGAVYLWWDGTSRTVPEVVR